MKFFRAIFPAASLILLILQLLMVGAVAATYAWQRHTYPRVWTRAYGYDPQLPLRGRYLSLRVAIDGCQSTLPSAKQALFPRDVAGAVKPGDYAVVNPPAVDFRARLQVLNGTLQSVYIQNEEQRRYGQLVTAWAGKSCHEMALAEPVNFYIADKPPGLLPLKPNQQLWIELTIPPQGPPRPTQLALKSDGQWKILASY